MKVIINVPDKYLDLVSSVLALQLDEGTDKIKEVIEELKKSEEPVEITDEDTEDKGKSLNTALAIIVVGKCVSQH